MYDIGVVGSGPAGAAVAKILADRFRVLLLDSGRRKCCGGILAPEAQKMLAQLDLSLPKSVLVDPQPFAVAILDTGTKLVRHYSRQYINIDRYAFDRWLLSLIPDNVDIRHEAVYRRTDPPVDREGPLTIHFTQDGEKRSERVRFLIGADGAGSTVRKEFFSKYDIPKRYIALQEWFPKSDVRFPVNGPINYRSDYVGIFDREFTDFYAWTVPKDDRLLVGGAIPFGPHAGKRLETLKKKLEQFGLILGNPVLREAGQLFRPLSTSSICLGSDRVFLIGEAAGLISPSSAEGISFALFSATVLAETLLSEVDRAASRYRRAVGRLFWSIRRKNFKSPGMFHPWLRKQIMLHRLTALDK